MTKRTTTLCFQLILLIILTLGRWFNAAAQNAYDGLSFSKHMPEVPDATVNSWWQFRENFVLNSAIEGDVTHYYKEAIASTGEGFELNISQEPDPQKRHSFNLQLNADGSPTQKIITLEKSGAELKLYYEVGKVLIEANHPDLENISTGLEAPNEIFDVAQLNQVIASLPKGDWEEKEAWFFDVKEQESMRSSGQFNLKDGKTSQSNQQTSMSIVLEPNWIRVIFRQSNAEVWGYPPGTEGTNIIEVLSTDFSRHQSLLRQYGRYSPERPGLAAVYYVDDSGKILLALNDWGMYILKDEGLE